GCENRLFSRALPSPKRKLRPRLCRRQAGQQDQQRGWFHERRKKFHGRRSGQQKNGRADPLPFSELLTDYFLLTAFLSSAPGVNFATLRAAILIVAPVCGLRPLRAFREDTAKVPNPIRATRSPFLRAAVMLSTAVSMAVPAAALLMPAPAAILSMRSPLFIVSPGRFEDPRRPVGEPYNARWSGNLAAAIFLPSSGMSTVKIRTGSRVCNGMAPNRASGRVLGT